jgi:hypothetical protein
LISALELLTSLFLLLSTALLVIVTFTLSAAALEAAVEVVLVDALASSAEDFFESTISSLCDRLRVNDETGGVAVGGGGGLGCGRLFSVSLFGELVVEEGRPVLFLRPFLPFLEEEEEVDMDELRP